MRIAPHRCQAARSRFRHVWIRLSWVAGLTFWVAGCDSGAPRHSSGSATSALVQGELIETPVVPATSPATNPAPVTAVPVVPEAVVKVDDASPAPTVDVPVPAIGSNTAASVQPGAGDPEFADVGFDKLSAFNFEVSDEILQSGSTNAVEVAARTAEQIPKTVREFDQKRIALKGFMLPLKVEGGKVTEMLVMRDQSMCCYGAVPKINEWVSVKMVGGGVKPIMDQAITLYGKLFVGEMRENGYLVGIYRMDGEKLDGPVEN